MIEAGIHRPIDPDTDLIDQKSNARKLPSYLEFKSADITEAEIHRPILTQT